jgi:soluble P-type ATPase
MSLVYEIPGAPPIELHTLVVDVNGTLTDRGELLDGVAERIKKLSARCTIHLVSADTFGTLDELAAGLSVQATRVSSGTDKLNFVNRVGATGCGVVGNGHNDALALRAAALGIVVLGPEGASPRALAAADVVCASIADALDLLADPRALAATIRP